MVNWVKSIYGNGEVTLAIRRRCFCGCSIYSIDKLPNHETTVVYNHAIHRFLEKGYLVKYLKEEKLVEAVSLAFYIRTRNDESNIQKTGDPKLQEIQLFLSPELLKIIEPGDWLKKVNNYINKNIAIKKQSDILLKKKFLLLFKDCRFFCSQVYDFTLYKAKIPDLPKAGKVCINISGLYFFDENNFKMPNMNMLLNDIVEFEQKGSQVKLKFNEGRALRTIFIKTQFSKQFCEEIASSMMLGLRENRYYVYSYLYVNKMLPPGITASRKSAVEQLHGQRISKCLENLTSQGDNMVPYHDLPFTKKYHDTIPQNKEEDYYFPFKVSDINRELSKQSAKKGKLPAMNIFSNLTSLQLDKKPSTIELPPKKASGKFIQDKEDGSSEEEEKGPEPANLNPDLFKLVKRR